MDHFRGSPEHRHDGSHPIAAIAQSGTSLPTFMANLQRCGLRDWVDIRVGSSVEVGSAWQGPIRFLFIDGDHSYDATRADVETWGKHVVAGGIIAFHDVDVWPGVTQVYREMLSDRSWREVCSVKSLRLIRRHDAGS